MAWAGLVAPAAQAVRAHDCQTNMYDELYLLSCLAPNSRQGARACTTRRSRWELSAEMGCCGSKPDHHPDGQAPTLTRKQSAAWEAKIQRIAEQLLFPALAAAAKPERGWQLPKLTTEQLAEWEQKKQRIVTQLGLGSTWDDKDASVLKQALAVIKLVDAAWLAALADVGGVLPRYQDLPAEAIVTLKEIDRLSTGLAVLVVSCPWVCPAF